MAKQPKFNPDDIKQARPVEGDAIVAVERGQGKGGQKTPTAEERDQRLADIKTQGRKGLRAPRFNFATTPENYSFINVMAGVTGRSVTRYLNYIIDEYRKDHIELYERAREIMDDAGMEDVTE